MTWARAGVWHKKVFVKWEGPRYMLVPHLSQRQLNIPNNCILRTLSCIYRTYLIKTMIPCLRQFTCFLQTVYHQRNPSEGSEIASASIYKLFTKTNIYNAFIRLFLYIPDLSVRILQFKSLNLTFATNLAYPE